MRPAPGHGQAERGFWASHTPEKGPLPLTLGMKTGLWILEVLQVVNGPEEVGKSPHAGGGGAQRHPDRPTK